MDIDFAEIVRALRDIGYAGDFTLEADQYLKRYTEADIFEGMKKMAAAARRLVAMYEGK